MIAITNPVTTSTPAESSSIGAPGTSADALSFADQLATVGENSSSTAAPQQDAFLQAFLAAASTTAAAAAPAASAPVVPTAAAAPTGTAAPVEVNTSDAPQGTPGYTISSTPPYFTPAPDQYVTVTSSNGMSPFQADSMDSYMQKFIGQSVSDMYGFINGTQSWANGGATEITNNFISMVQQRVAVYPSMGQGIDPVAMGTQYANAFMQVLSGVKVSQFGATNFTGTVMDFLGQGGSPAPTVLNQLPSVLSGVNA